MDTSYLPWSNNGLDMSLYGIILVAITGAYAIQGFYRLYFHPLAKIPGPKLTAATSLYEFYYDVICGGRFLFQIEKMHETYGPIVRINPREIHIIDPSFYHEIYAPGTRKRDKELSVVSAYGVPYSMAATIKHDHHRYRRGLLNDFFSKRSVLFMSPVVEARVERLMERLQGFHDNSRVFNICNAFGALTSDIITHYCYGKHWGFLEDEEFRSDIRTATDDFTAFSHVNRFFPFLTGLLRSVPARVMALLMPGKAVLFEFERSIFQHFSAVIQGKVFTLTGDHNIVKKLHSPEIPAEERTLSRLQDEGFTFLVAGTETTMRALSFTAYHVYQDRAMLERLRTELREVLPTPNSKATWPTLEKLPYLNAVINEALRLSNAAIIRLPRAAPHETLQYKEHVIPPGTPMSTSIYFVHRNPAIYPDPEKFDPERWMKAAETGDPLHRYLVPFTKGSRICIGMNLAFLEMYLTIAYYIRRFDLEICETDPESIRVTRERVNGYPEHGGLQIKARVKAVLQD